jgi:hypothetical protein
MTVSPRLDARTTTHIPFHLICLPRSRISPLQSPAATVFGGLFASLARLGVASHEADEASDRFALPFHRELYASAIRKGEARWGFDFPRAVNREHEVC